LARGAQQRQHPFRIVVLATVDAQLAPQLRNVVLRQVDIEQATVVCHTDYRSEKVLQIQQHNLVSWLFYDPGQQIQLRLQGRAQLHYHDQIAGAAWEQTPARHYYCGLAPAMAVAQPNSGLPTSIAPELTAAESAAGWDNFAVIRSGITTIDWLKLGVNGHYRAQFWRDAENWRGTWVTP
jgi:hypothetical protein